MSTRLVRCATSAFLALALAPEAQAGDGRPRYDPFAAAGRAPVCTEAELSAGFDVDQCGRGLLHMVAARKADRAGTE
ncbi:MAG: hypothetical protein U1E59_16745 [Amaricoccus sp.]